MGEIVAAGLDPDQLPEGDLKTMDFGTGEGSKAKAWRDIWGSGQGIGAVEKVQGRWGLCGAADCGICGSEGKDVRNAVKLTPTVMLN